MLTDVKENIVHCLKCGACRLDWITCEPICPSGIKYGFDSYYAIGRGISCQVCYGRETGAEFRYDEKGLYLHQLWCL